jgi:hypothetical protein
LFNIGLITARKVREKRKNLKKKSIIYIIYPCSTEHTKISHYLSLMKLN